MARRIDHRYRVPNLDRNANHHQHQHAAHCAHHQAAGWGRHNTHRGRKSTPGSANRASLDPDADPDSIPNTTAAALYRIAARMDT
jgi:hypothetical protein